MDHAGIPPDTPLSWLVPALAWAIPVLLLAGGTLAVRKSDTSAGGWRISEWTTAIVLLLALSLPALAPWLAHPENHYLLHLTGTPLIMQILVAFLGYVIVRYSRRNLNGEGGQGRYLLWLHSLLAAVVLVVMTNHLLVFLAAWIGISLSLHQLLMFYPDRPRAALAAHKKFLLARLAETLLLTAFILLANTHDSWRIDEILQNLRAAPPSLADQIAALLLAGVALIKCAQLPVHGWLIQVVEAPTPVSALLHAGVINLGGVLLILFAPLIMQVPAAQWLLLLVAGTSTVLAALIMTTRVSIKVRLAWSTSAQMGLMLVECALGLYELALLHLLAHSLYKAHAFLNSGNAVAESVQLEGAPLRPLSARGWVAITAWLAVGLGCLLWLAEYQGPWSPWLLLSFSLAVWLATPYAKGSTERLHLLPVAAGLIFGYILLKSTTALALETLPAFTPSPAADLWVAFLFVVLLSLAWLLRYRAWHPQVQRLAVMLYAGLYADEWFTRTTLKLWPTRLPARARIKHFDNSAQGDLS